MDFQRPLYILATFQPLGTLPQTTRYPSNPSTSSDHSETALPIIRHPFFFNSLHYKPSCALILTLRQTHHHHPYSTCNAEKYQFFFGVASFFTLLLITSSHETKLNQCQRSLRSKAGSIPGYRAGQSRVEPRDEPT